MMEKLFRKKKRFDPLEKHLYQKGKVETMPVVTGRLVIFEL